MKNTIRLNESTLRNIIRNTLFEMVSEEEFDEGLKDVLKDKANNFYDKHRNAIKGVGMAAGLAGALAVAPNDTPDGFPEYHDPANYDYYHPYAKMERDIARYDSIANLGNEHYDDDMSVEELNESHIDRVIKESIRKHLKV